ncbi:MAG TPA: MFS transporter [Nocardioides sp.]|nr:MFS transporter [Nocardioides sp.]
MLQRLGFPAVGDHRRFVAAIVADTLGSGLFMPVTLLYFLATSPLSLAQIGSALSVSALLTLPAAVFVGSAVDRFGPRRVMLFGNLVQVAGMLAYLLVDSFWPLALWTVVLNVGRQCFWGSFGNVVTIITEPGERELWFGFLQAMRNLGYAVGGVLAGIAVQIGTVDVYHGVVVVNAASFALAWWLLLSVPDHRPVADEAQPVGGWADVVRDRPYLVLVLTQFGYVLGVMVLNFALPVYAAESIGLPGWVVGGLFTLNTVMVGLGQGLTVRAMTGQQRARMVALAHGFFAAGYLLFILAGAIPVWLGVVTVLVGTGVYTLGELTGGPVLSAVAAEAAPDHLRGRYLSLFQFSWGLGGVVAPAVYTGLLASGEDVLWLVLLGVTAVAAPFSLRLARTLPTAAEPVTNRSAR